jgi:ribose transport system ATP-binding protein
MVDAALLEIRDVSKRFGANQALDQAFLTVEAGEVHALVGVNGAGKSTMMKILAGVHSADSGEIQFRGEAVRFSDPRQAESAGIAIVYQELSVLDDLSVADNILIRHLPGRGWIGKIDRSSGNRRAEEALGRLGLSIDPAAMVGDLPVGQKQLIEIAKALSSDASLVIFDEPTSALSDHETHALFAAIRSLKADGVGVVYISHHLDELFQIADRVTVLRDGKSVATREMVGMDISTVVELMLGSRSAIPTRKSRRQDAPPVLAADSISTDKLRGPLSLELRPGEIVALCGRLGSGRTETLRALFGVDRLLTGTVRGPDGPLKDGPGERIRSGIGFVPEERKVEGIITDSTIGLNITVASYDQLAIGGHIVRRREAQRAQEAVLRVGVVPADSSRVMESLSGGNQQKAILGRWISRRGIRVLLLDDPTRGVDVGAKTQIYQLLDEMAANGVGILFASSDEEEILGVADRIHVLRRGEIVHSAPTADLSLHELTTLIVGGQI